MRLKAFKSAILAIALLLPILASAAESRHMRAQVVATSDFPRATSGYIITWVGISVIEDRSFTTIQLLETYVSREQPLPHVGDHCVFDVHNERAGGFVGSSTVDTYDAAIVDGFRCDVRQ